jgi:radical SAM superfamily enzyme YgiQ (UPF0313 family)
MRILLVYPSYPDTFWSFRHALRFVSKKACFPPLGLLTVASMLPADWEKKLVDLNVEGLRDEDIRWADYVFLSAMAVQSKSARETVERCNRLGTPVVAGGPLFTMAEDRLAGVSHFVLGEGEVTLPAFLKDLADGCPKEVYECQEHPPLDSTPLPQWSLINMRHYATMSIQYSRGCPFDCEFCDIILLNGHRPRTKSTESLQAELNALYTGGWRGSVFIVDDNFIGNKKKLKMETLPAMARWSEERGHPFSFFTEASINLADDEELMRLMASAGFNRVFIGIETPNEDSLAECNKSQNTGRDLAECVRTIQNHGFEVQGGFIVGFDSDPSSIFRSQINFIQKTGIVAAMVGLLNAPRGTRLYQRLKKENRLTTDFTGDNTDCSLNFEPKMNRDALIDGYKHILSTIYSPKHYYGRITTFLKEYKPPKLRVMKAFRPVHIPAFFRIIWSLGVVDGGRAYFWRLLLSTTMRRPRLLPISFNLAVFGVHFRKVAEKVIASPVATGPSAGSAV